MACETHLYAKSYFTRCGWSRNWGSLVSHPTSSMNSSFSERPSLKNKGGEWLTRTSEVSLWSLHAQEHPSKWTHTSERGRVNFWCSLAFSSHAEWSCCFESVVAPCTMARLYCVESPLICSIWEAKKKIGRNQPPQILFKRIPWKVWKLWLPNHSMNWNKTCCNGPLDGPYSNYSILPSTAWTHVPL